MRETDLKDKVEELARVAPHVHPTIHHLFAMLPPAGEPFPVEQRREFIVAARSLFTLIYAALGSKLTKELAGFPARFATLGHG